MKTIAAVWKNDYRLVAGIVFVLAILSGLVMERIYFGLSTDSVSKILSEYSGILTGYAFDKSEMVRYLMKSELKKYLILILLSFSVVGIFGNLIVFFATVYHYVFLMAAVYRSDIGSAYVLCIAAVLLCLLSCLPVFLYCIRLSCKSFVYCTGNGTKLYHCTKYQLQTELKIGIIILLYTTLGIIAEGMICTGLFGRMFV